MKSTYALLRFAAILASLAACGTDGSPVDASGADITNAPAAKPRTMGTAPAMPTKPTNLLHDPLFSTVGAADAFLFFAENATATVEYPATSPAGPAAPVLRLTPTAAGASAGLTAQGGTGPFDVRIRIAFAPGGDPAVSLMTMAGEAYPLTLAGDAEEVHESRTYRTFAARIPGPLYGQLVLGVEPKGTDPVWLAAPEIVSAAPATTGAYHVAERSEPRAPAVHLVRAVAARRVRPRPITRPTLPLSF
jgi:hypothetical protein